MGKHAGGIHGHEIRSECTSSMSRATPRVTRGLGRAYGDAAPSGCGGLRHYPEQPSLTESSPSTRRTACCVPKLDSHSEHLYRLFLPRGYFTPELPGHSLRHAGGHGGDDVHGKNHHRDGTFGQHVISMSLRVADGRFGYVFTHGESRPIQGDDRRDGADRSHSHRHGQVNKEHHRRGFCRTQSLSTASPNSSTHSDEPPALGR